MAVFRVFDYLKNGSYKPSTKQLLNNFWGQFFRKAQTIFGARVKNGLFIKKVVISYLEEFQPVTY